MVEAYKPIYTVKEAAKVLKVNASKVYELINTGRLPYMLLGQKKIKGYELEAFIVNYPAAEPGVIGDEDEGAYDFDSVSAEANGKS